MSDDRKHIGRSANRLPRNELERRFAEAWQESNDQCQTLAYLLSSNPNVANWFDVSDRDIEVAATIIQWLGSPVGQAFIDEVHGCSGCQR